MKNLKPFKKGQSGNPDGRPKGSRNRAPRWRPMALAPLDGTEVLLYGPYQWENYTDNQKFGIVVGMYWEGNWVLVNANPYVDFIEPTHWKPLPKKPRGAK